MNSLKTISYTRLGSSKLQLRVDGKIRHFEGGASDIQNIVSMVDDALKHPEKMEQVSDFLSGKPRPFFGDFTITQDGEIFFRDTAEAVAPSLAQKIKTAKETNDKKLLSALTNFQARLVVNRNAQARADLHAFLEANGLSITPKGYFVSYKAVRPSKSSMSKSLSAYLKSHAYQVHSDYLVKINKEGEKTFDTFGFGAIKNEDSKRWIPSLDKDPIVSSYDILGRLDSLYDELESNGTGCFVDKHTGSIQQRVGDLVTMPRAECDSDPLNSCSYGLHVGSPEYVNSFASNGDGILVALVSPTDVIAVPSHDAHKMRVCQYFITGFSNLDLNNKIIPVNDLLFEDDYEQVEIDAVMAELEEGNYEHYILPEEREDEVNLEEMRALIQKRLKRHETY